MTSNINFGQISMKLCKMFAESSEFLSKLFTINVELKIGWTINKVTTYSR